jgi:hypothetical protein
MLYGLKQGEPVICTRPGDYIHHPRSSHEENRFIMTIELKIAQECDAKEWDSIISKSCHGTLFHSWTWLQLAAKHTHTILYPLIGIKDNTPVAVFPLFYQRKGPIRLVFSPPPSTVMFYLGPVIADYDKMKQEKREKIFIDFQTSVDNFIKNELNAQYVNISLTPYLEDPRPFLWSGYNIESQYDYVIDLSRGAESLLRAIDKKQRQNLSRAKKRGIVVESGGRNEFEGILNLMDIRYQQQGRTVRSSRKYLLDIYDAYQDNMKIFVAKLNEEVLTGTIDFQYKDTHYSWIGNPKPKNQVSPSPNDLVIWESVRFAQEMGMKYYVTMNAAGNSRLHSYYASKYDPDLKVHFSLKRTSCIMSLLEKGYSGFFKSLL